MEKYKLFFEVIAGGLALLGVFWGYLKVTYLYREKFLFITNAHLLPKTFWDEIKKRYTITEYGDHDHAFRPLVFLPEHMKPYLKVKNGEKVMLESRETDSDALSISAIAWWIPQDMQPWCGLQHPMLSLIIRRYFRIERPLFQGEEQAPEGWTLIRHDSKHLDPLHRADETNPTMLVWAGSNSFSWRYYNPTKQEFTDESDEDALIEYCGLSLRIRRRSLFQIGN